MQLALLKALETWTRAGVPDKPSAWLFQVARNALLGDLRQRSDRLRLLDKYKHGVLDDDFDDQEHRLSGELSDELLLMLFACCDEAIPIESQLVFALKILCGFSVPEIAQRLFTTEANVYKRLGRARRRLREVPAPLGELCDKQYASRLPAVQRILYVLFTEGYLSCHVSQPIREELCHEAIRLATLLAHHPVGRHPRTHALLALMHLHGARLSAREDASGGLLLLEEQNRGLWDQQGIQTGLMWLARSAEGTQFSRYHAEAGIAAEHGLAPSFVETRWDRIVENYELLETVAPSALHRLNRAVSVAQQSGPRAGLEVLQGFQPPSWLEGSYQWFAVLADLHLRCGETSEGARYAEQAIEMSPTEAIGNLLKRRLQHELH